MIGTVDSFFFEIIFFSGEMSHNKDSSFHNKQNKWVITRCSLSLLVRQTKQIFLDKVFKTNSFLMIYYSNNCSKQMSNFLLFLIVVNLFVDSN